MGLKSGTWNCCGKLTDTDARGITTKYDYDDLKRVSSQTTTGPQGDIVTTYTYDAAGRRLSQTVTAGGITQSSSSVYDLAGRLLSSTDSQGLTTTYGYENNGLRTTVTRPGGATEITERYLDGRVKSVTGTGVIPCYYEYGVDADKNTQWTKVYNGGSNSLQWEKTTTDLMGRTVKSEKPGFKNTGTETVLNFYDGTGHLIKTTSPGMAAMLYSYDELGNQISSGLDVDGNGSLDPASTDRITMSAASYVSYNSAIWQKTEQSVYAGSSAAATTVATQMARLTGLGSGLVSESISIDVNGNKTDSKTIINRATQTETRTVTYTDSTTPEQQVSVNGVVTSTTSKTGITTTFGYDAFGRRISATDPRTGTAITQYDTKGRVDFVQDAKGNKTTFAYDDVTGRKKAEINADNKYTRYAYNTLGQVTATWGDAAYPVSYAYDDYGRLATMTTYRDGDFSGEVFPTGASGDTTTWNYDTATGLLLSKTDAANKAVTYTYGPAGRLTSRTWARTANNLPVVTTYSYYDATGELKNISYSDGTTPVTFAYNRLGQQQTVTDTVGTRSFTYGTNLQLGSEAITGITPATITRNYETAGVVGRPSGFTLGSDYSITYGYDTPDTGAGTGRFNSVVWTVGGQSGTVLYSYLSNSDLLSGLTSTPGLQTLYAYEDHRNLRTMVSNQFSSNSISQYDYNYDKLGRRDRVDTTGQAFVGTPHNSYGYNLRSELEESKRFLGTTDDPAQLVNAEYRKYVYDPIGNRTSATEGASTGARQLTYTANQLNQYTLIASPVEASPGYDADGNLTTAPAGIAGAADTLLKYDAENRLISVEPQALASGSTKVEFVYDYMSRRTAKKVFAYAAGAWSLQSTSTFIYDGWNLIKEQSTINNQQSTSFYVWGLDLSGSLQGAGGIGGLLARVKDGAAQQYTFDGNGNVSELLNSDGTLAAHYEYDPYGNAIVATGSDNPFRFSTKYLDGETGLYYYGYRYYSPTLGRWLNRDPIGELGGLNVYGFVGNNPLKFVDLLGQVLISVDGTGSSRWAVELDNGRWLSHVRNFYQDYKLKSGESKAYWHGPNMKYTGQDANAIHRSIIEYLQGIICKNECEKINMVGHSRGGYIVMEVAREIGSIGISCKDKTIKPRVNFLGLYEAVDMVLWYGKSQQISSNVDYIAVARNDSGSRPYFSAADEGSPIMMDGMTYAHAWFDVTHSGLGGDPWGGDKLLPIITHGMTEKRDIAGSKLVDRWMRRNANNAGIKFN